MTTPPPRARRWPVEYTVFAVMTVLLVLAPLVVYSVTLMQCLCLALFACAFNLLIGYVGLLSFGHAMFLGAAGYAAAHAAKVWGLTPELAILFGTACAAVAGLVVGWLAIRRQGIYFSMITLGLAQMFYFFCVRAEFTHGEDSIQGVPRGHLFGLIDLDNNTVMYGFVLVVFLIGFSIIYRIIHSPFGAVLTAIRENETRTTSLGYNPDHYKLIAFVLSAALAGTAGATKALALQVASLTDVQWTTSGAVVLMTLIGGLGRYTGPVVGAFFVAILEHYLASTRGLVPVIEGAVFVVFVLIFRQGIIGGLSNRLKLPL
ncbi:MAG TPA: branched-chain amino acid ABC transporter permease [Kofleriaceae bacterium]|nr:branched-chain amino acid ABC transporter permease [Kofleriaceae bacterium]